METIVLLNIDLYLLDHNINGYFMMTFNLHEYFITIFSENTTTNKFF